MKTILGRSAVLLLMALASACQKQDISNVDTENTFVSDETSDGNFGEFDNLSGSPLDNADSARPTN